MEGLLEGPKARPKETTELMFVELEPLLTLTMKLVGAFFRKSIPKPLDVAPCLDTIEIVLMLGLSVLSVADGQRWLSSFALPHSAFAAGSRSGGAAGLKD